MSVDLTGLGTSEAQWQAWSGLAELPELALPGAPSGPPSPDRVVLVAPHPDDEVLGAGGTAAMLAAAGVAVVVVAVTGGEASHPGSPTVTPGQLLRRRRAERAAALGYLGLAGSGLVSCAVADGGVEACTEQLTDTLAGLLSERSWCLAPWSRDGHPDHDATGRAAVAATARTGAHRLSYLVWIWHWARPADAQVPWDNAVKVTLPQRIWRAKLAAAGEFTSQTVALSAHSGDRAVLPPPVLHRLTRSFEVFLR